MATPDQVIQHVKFALEGLSERNAHHEFEHASRHLARYRIAFNLLPATGPVAAGGDRGRDFETFPTFVGGIVDGKFSAETPNARLAFPCSLDRQVGRKVREVAMLNAAANYRTTLKLGVNSDIQEFQKAMNAEVFSAETAERPEVPVISLACQR
jgi:hypothetical protein